MSCNDEWITRGFEVGSADQTEPLVRAEFSTVAGMLLRLQGASIPPETEPIATPDLTTLTSGEEDLG
jgi:hypothetical protein